MAVVLDYARLIAALNARSDVVRHTPKEGGRSTI